MYVMSYFRTEAEALHLAVSEDGLAWRPLNQNRPITGSQAGARSIRDPHICPDRAGRFHLFATNGWHSDSILHAVSDDLFTWTDHALVPVMAGVPGVRNCWAPECFYDHEEDLYRVIWSSSTTAPTSEVDWNHRIWGTTTRDFRTYTPAELFLDPGYSVIDATVAWHDGLYLLAFKDERGENRFGTDHKAIRVCLTRRTGGPFTELSALVTPALTEGPTVFRRDGAWTMFFDQFMENRFGALSSPDGRAWTDITAQVTFPPGPRHAGVFEVDETTAAVLRSAL